MQNIERGNKAYQPVGLTDMCACVFDENRPLQMLTESIPLMYIYHCMVSVVPDIDNFVGAKMSGSIHIEACKQTASSADRVRHASWNRLDVFAQRQ
jgi:hypothetical protein